MLGGTVGITYGVVLCGLALAAVSSLRAEEMPSLADELRAAIDAGGAEAAMARFNELYPAHKDDYRVDLQDIMMMASEYIQAGDMDVVQVIGEINAVIGQDMVSSAMAAEPAMAKQTEAMKQTEKEQATRAQTEEERMLAEVAREREGKVREDLWRFTGLYGDPADTRPNRQLWVAASCDGFLVVGARWGDVAPWWMRSAADTVFTYADSFFSLALEFRTGDGGQAETLAHDLAGLSSPLQRVGPLTDDFPDCFERPRR